MKMNFFGLVIGRLIKEMFLPFIVASGWTAWNYFEYKNRTFLLLATDFCAAFFFFSWLPAQIHRVIKQIRVEKNLDSIEEKIINLLQQLENSTERMVSHITGGNSFCYIKSACPGSRISIEVIGEYSIYDLQIRIVDIDALSVNLATNRNFETVINIGVISPGFDRFLSESLPLGDSTYRSFNAFLIGRNGYFTQLLRFAKVNGNWAYATKVYKMDSGGNSLGEFYNYVSKDFPLNSENLVEWN